MKIIVATTAALLLCGTFSGAVRADPAQAPTAAPTKTSTQPASAAVVHRAPAAVGASAARSPFDGEDPVALGAALRQLRSSFKMSEGGTALLKAGDVHGARAGFEQALALEPHNPDALYGLARCAGASGDTAGALGYYRRAVYRQARSVLDMDGSGFLETDVPHLMEFVLALGRAGQADEAVAVYDHAAGLLDAAGGGAHSLGVDLPYLGDGPGQVPYTPQALQAMAHLAIGITAPGFDGVELRKAAALAPDSAAVQYYLGKYLVGNDNAAARVVLERAIQLGDAQTAKEASVYLKMAR